MLLVLFLLKQEVDLRFPEAGQKCRVSKGCRCGSQEADKISGWTHLVYCVERRNLWSNFAKKEGMARLYLYDDE